MNVRFNNKIIFRLRYPLIFFLCCYASSIWATDDFQAWRQSMLSDFSSYKSKQDKAFAEFLKMHWVGVDALKRKPLYKKHKIVEPPKAPPEIKKDITEEPVIVKLPPRKLVPKKQVSPVISRVKGRSIKLQFFGNALVVPYDKSIKKRILGKIDKNAISDQWSVLAKSDYEPMMKQLKTLNKQLNLNDWGYALLVDRVANKIYPNQKNEQAMFSWFVLIKSGYKSRIAYGNRAIYLLLATRQPIYAAQSIKFNGLKYYLLDFNGGKQEKLARVFTYDGDYPESKQLFDMRIQDAMVTGKDEVNRSLEFTYAQKKYRIDTVSNKNLVAFMKTYPQVRWDAYFNSSFNSAARQKLASQLRPNLAGLSEKEAVNFLLRFVQTSLKYATDGDQFGYENPLFPEESLFYPASDCEDRSFLFAWLVQTLLGLDVVGLHYPGHIATAVRLNMKVKGDSIRYKGKTYLVADPTYINANVGNAMPKFKNAKAELIEINRI